MQAWSPAGDEFFLLEHTALFADIAIWIDVVPLSRKPGGVFLADFRRFGHGGASSFADRRFVARRLAALGRFRRIRPPCRERAGL
jgi:hypothetical protein